MKVKVVALFGIDGAGKTSVAMRLTKELSNNGRPTVYARPKFGLHLWSGRHESQSPPLANPPGSRNSRFTQTLRCAMLLLLMVEHLLDIFIRVWIPLRRGRTVIVDRYWPDTIVDLVVDFGIPYHKAKRLASLGGLGVQSIYVHLEVPCHIAISRKPGPYTLEYLQKREAVYGRLRQEIGAMTASTEIEMDKTLMTILPTILDEKG